MVSEAAINVIRDVFPGVRLALPRRIPIPRVYSEDVLLVPYKDHITTILGLNAKQHDIVREDLKLFNGIKAAKITKLLKEIAPAERKITVIKPIGITPNITLGVRSYLARGKQVA